MAVKTPLRALAGIVLLAWSVAALATASNKELEDRANETDARLAAVERANQTLVQLQQQVEAMRQELRTLRGQLDEVRHEIEGLQKQQRDLYSDLDRRLLLIENGVQPGVREPGRSIVSRVSRRPTVPRPRENRWPRLRGRRRTRSGPPTRRPSTATRSRR